MPDVYAEELAHDLADFIEDVDPTTFQEEAADVGMTMDEYRDIIIDDVYRAIREYSHDMWAAQYMDGVIGYLSDYVDEGDDDASRMASCLLDSLHSIGIGKEDA